MLQNADQQTQRLAYAANFLLSACWEATSETDRDERLKQALVQVEYNFKDLPVEQLEAEGKQRLKKAGCPNPFHWPLEFPEVFMDRGGFDAIVGNPPFMGGTKIRSALGPGYLGFLRRFWNGGGRADLCAYFFVRAWECLCPVGNFGLLATNTIAQGETHAFGLDKLTTIGCVIIRAVPSQPWPGMAALEVSHVWGHRGGWSGAFYINDQQVSGITSFLTQPEGLTGTPFTLVARRSKSFLGSYLLGMGFVIEPDQAQQLICCNSRNRDVLFLFLNGEDLNSRFDQSPSRWVINFRDWPLDRSTAPEGYAGPVAQDYPDCLDIVEHTVRPERLKKAADVAKAPWWQFWRVRSELYASISELTRILVTSRVSAHHFMEFAPLNYIFSDRLVVVACERNADFAVLSSWIHDAWAHRPGSTTHETRNTYFPESSFETYPHSDEFISTGGDWGTVPGIPPPDHARPSGRADQDL